MYHLGIPDRVDTAVQRVGGQPGIRGFCHVTLHLILRHGSLVGGYCGGIQRGIVSAIGGDVDLAVVDEAVGVVGHLWDFIHAMDAVGEVLAVAGGAGSPVGHRVFGKLVFA